MADDLERDIRTLTNRLDTVMEKVDQRNDSMIEIEEDLKIVLLLLKGNELNRDDAGLVGSVVDLRKRVYKLERFKDKAIYMIIGFSFGAGWAISDIITKIFMK